MCEKDFDNFNEDWRKTLWLEIDKLNEEKGYECKFEGDDLLEPSLSYALLLKLGDKESDKIQSKESYPILTFTSPTKFEDSVKTVPSAAYLSVIAKGLVKTYPGSDFDLVTYLTEATNNTWDRQWVERLFDQIENAGLRSEELQLEVRGTEGRDSSLGEPIVQIPKNSPFKIPNLVNRWKMMIREFRFKNYERVVIESVREPRSAGILAYVQRVGEGPSLHDDMSGGNKSIGVDQKIRASLGVKKWADDVEGDSVRIRHVVNGGHILFKIYKILIGILLSVLLVRRRY